VQARSRGAFSPADRDDKRHLLAGGDSSGDVEAGVLRSAPPPAWVDLHQELVEEMERAQRKTEDLKKLHRQHLLPGFDEDDRYTEQQQIDQLAREIAQSLQSCDLGVKQISAPGGGQRNLSPQEARVRSSAQTSLATRLHGLTQRYRKEQDSYIGKLEKQQGAGESGGGGGGGARGTSLDPFADDDGLGGGGGGGGGNRQTSQQIANANEEEIRFRDGEISKVARSVQEIATLMQDLSALVIDQVRSHASSGGSTNCSPSNRSQTPRCRSPPLPDPVSAACAMPCLASACGFAYSHVRNASLPRSVHNRGRSSTGSTTTSSKPSTIRRMQSSS
jgi:hypothetical protein